MKTLSLDLRERIVATYDEGTWTRQEVADRLTSAATGTEAAEFGLPFVAAHVSAWIGPIHRLTTAATNADLLPIRDDFAGLDDLARRAAVRG